MKLKIRCPSCKKKHKREAGRSAFSIWVCPHCEMTVDEGDAIQPRRLIRRFFNRIGSLVAWPPRQTDRAIRAFLRAAWWCVPKPWRWGRVVQWHVDVFALGLQKKCEELERDMRERIEKPVFRVDRHRSPAWGQRNWEACIVSPQKPEHWEHCTDCGEEKHVKEGALWCHDCSVPHGGNIVRGRAPQGVCVSVEQYWDSEKQSWEIRQRVVDPPQKEKEPRASDSLPESPAFSPGDRVRVNCEGCVCAAPGHCVHENGREFTVKWNGSRPPKAHGPYAALPPKAGPATCLSGHDGPRYCPASQLTKVEEEKGECGVAPGGHCKRSCSSPSCKFYVLGWRPKVGEWVWVAPVGTSVKAQPARITRPLEGVTYPFECEIIDGSGALRYIGYHLQEMRPLSLSEVETEEQAKQFYGRKAKLVKGPLEGEIWTINGWMDALKAFSCTGARMIRVAQADYVRLLEE